MLCVQAPAARKHRAAWAGTSRAAEGLDGRSAGGTETPAMRFPSLSSSLRGSWELRLAMRVAIVELHGLWASSSRFSAGECLVRADSCQGASNTPRNFCSGASEGQKRPESAMDLKKIGNLFLRQKRNSSPELEHNTNLK